MKNRQNLREWGIVLIVFAIAHLFVFISTIVTSIVDGSITAALAEVDPSIVGAVKAVLIVLAVIMGLFVFADAFIGIKGMKVSANPSADKWHINLAKVFCVLTTLVSISFIVSFFTGSPNPIDGGLGITGNVLSTCAYVLFIQHATAVRNDFINGKK